MLFEWLKKYDWEALESKPASLGKGIVQIEDEADLDGVQVLIIGVNESRGDQSNKGCKDGADAIRAAFGGLQNHFPKGKIGDLGNIDPGAELSDTCYALEKVLEMVHAKGKVVAILGGSQDLSFTQMKGLKAIKEALNLVIVDREVDMLDEPAVNAGNFIHHMVTQESQFVFNLSHLGGQMHFIEEKKLFCLERMNFDVQRLGDIREDISKVEPEVRDAHLLSFDVSAIRGADFKGYHQLNPNGLFGEEACRILRYAGISDSMRSVGFYGYDPSLDPAGLGANLSGQMLWYFFDGVFARKNDQPSSANPDYLKYVVHFEEENMDVTFLKSKRSERWWMEIEYFKEGESYRKLVSCDYTDYSLAMQGNIPSRWFRANEKLV